MHDSALEPLSGLSTLVNLSNLQLPLPLEGLLDEHRDFGSRTLAI